MHPLAPWLFWFIVYLISVLILRYFIRRSRYRRHIKDIHKAEDWYDEKYGDGNKEDHIDR